MTDIEKLEYNALLYDFYGELLTDRQKDYFEEHVCNDLTISEIAEERKVSRQAVHDMIKRTEKILQDYEDKLHLVDKFMRIKQQIKQIENEAHAGDSKQILYLTQQLLEEL